jgi:hypothetical protein
MANNKSPGKKNQEEEQNLKGTLYSVMIVGGFILVSWFAVLILFLLR